MRYMDAANVMVPVAACVADGGSQQNTKLSACDVKPPTYLVPPAHLSDSICAVRPWVQLSKESLPTAKRKETYYNHADGEISFHVDENIDTFLQCNRNCTDGLSQNYFPCRLPDALMNGAEKVVTMTGSSNHHSDQLSWLSEVASAAAKGTLNNKHLSSPNQSEQQQQSVGDAAPSQFLLSSNSGSVFSAPIVVARPAGGTGLRMFTQPFQIERTRHVQHATLPGSATMYYSQASRTTPLSTFFQAASSSNVTNSSINNPDPSRSYLQLACSPSYSSNSTNLVIPSSHGGRMFQHGRSILISRSPEGMVVQSPIERDACHQVQIQLSPTLPQSQEEAVHRKSFTSSDSMLGSSSCSPVIETSQSASHNADFSAGRQSTSPSHTGYRLPTGKEGSLKHRILRPPSINILDPPQSIVADAPLSAPPIRTQHELSPKQVRSIPSSGYRSFSSSASSITEVSNRVVASPGGTHPNHCSSFSSSGCASPVPPSSPGTAAQLKYPQSFMKGSIIQLANNKLKQVEDMTTEDFVECGLLSSTLKIDSSTVTSIEKTPFTGAAKLGFHVGQDNIQITVEAPLEHPFFVYKQGWSSCSPERSAQRYGLTCHKLKVGDVCISLTDKPPQPTSQKVTNIPVPIVSVSDSNQNLCTLQTKEGAPEIDLLLDKNTQSDGRKRKRRWSAPDNLSQEGTVGS